MSRCLSWLWIALLLVSCEPAVKLLDCKVVAEYPHDSNCYTQGLEFHEGQLLESGGGYGASTVRRVDPVTGKELNRRDFPDTIFAEGLTVLNGELFLLTWRENVAYVLDPKSFELIRRHRYEGEGWGLANDGRRLVMSNGSNRIEFRDPQDFKVLDAIEVTEMGQPLAEINELEWVDGRIWANIYNEDRLVCIDPVSGKVLSTVDCGDLRERLPKGAGPPVEEFNGIARHPTTGRFWVTGKYWPVLFEVEIGKR